MKRFQFSHSTNKKLNIIVGCLAAVIWVVMLYLALQPDGNQPKQILTSNVHYTASAGQSDGLAVSQVTPYAIHPTTSSLPSASRTTPSSGASSFIVHETSSTSAHTVGSGSGNGMANSWSNGNSGNISYGGNMVALSSSLALAAPGASHANDIAKVAAAPERRGAGPRRVDQNNKPDGPFEDPVGDALLPLALLACAYILIRATRKKMQA